MSGTNLAALAGAILMLVIGVLFFSGAIKPPADPTTVQTATATQR